MTFPRIIITGVGPICAAGTGVPALWESLQNEHVEIDVLAAPVGAEHSWGSYPFYRPKPWTVHPEDKELPEDAELTLCISALRLAAGDASVATERLG